MSTASVAKATATITAAYGATFMTTFGPAPTATRAAAASIFDPSKPDPTAVDPTNPLILFILQAFVVIALSRILGWGLGKIRQPKVIAEVIAGLIVGPSVLGRAPGFTKHVFPPASIPYLSLVANIGLTLFLFLVGLEVDFSLFRRNARMAISISLIGMIIPFAVGAAVSVGIYNNFVDETKVKFGTFLLFIGVANAITAFPVLARILTELDLLRDFVGVTVLTAGVGNDVVGWVLLALAIALTNASSGIIILYILLTCVGWILALFFIIRPLLIIACRKTGAFGEKGMGEGLCCLVLGIVGVSAWITDRIGIHAIFGGFIVGLIVPHEIRHSLVEKIEDLVSVLFLPLYFALSGLKTDLGLLSDGSIWGWTICVIISAFLSKFIACGGVAKLMGMDWRESGAVGSLMACKGLVELIVLNIGYNAGILNAQVFACFVTMALVTTFLTTPLTLLFYPASYRLGKARALKEAADSSIPGRSSSEGDLFRQFSRYSIVLQQFDHLPALFAFTRLIKAPSQVQPIKARGSAAADSEKEMDEEVTRLRPVAPVSVNALRLIELTERTSALLRASESPATLLNADSLSNVFSSFTRGAGIATATQLEIVNPDTYPGLVASHAEEKQVDVVVLPWTLHKNKQEEGIAGMLPNPFEMVFGKPLPVNGSSDYASYVRRVFGDAACDVALFIDRGLSLATNESTAAFSNRAHLFFAFHGGADDRTTLAYLIHLVSVNPFLTATVLRVTAAGEPTSDDEVLSTGLANKESLATTTNTEDHHGGLLDQLTVQGHRHNADTLYPTLNDVGSETADEVALATYFAPATDAHARPAHIEAAMTRIEFTQVETFQPLHMTVARARSTALVQAPGVPLIVLVGRGRRGGAKSTTKELEEYLKANLEKARESVVNSSEVRRGLGDVGTAYVLSEVGSSIMVVQSGKAESGQLA